MKIHNPANGALITEIEADDAAAVSAKAERARAAQPAWNAVPMAERKACIARFRDALEAQVELLAETLTAEVGKPIRQSRNEIHGVQVRLDFFLAQAERSTASETVFAEQGLTERITHEPLGVVGNVSAWNYPYFVGSNVFVPALLTGNAVLYKPSEFATLTGLQITRLLHESGVPTDAFIAVPGDGETGAALVGQRIDGLFFTGSHATGARIAAALGPRLVKLQLELGGKDPTYVCEDAPVQAAAESLADGAMYNTGQSCCSVERIYVHERIHDEFVEAFLATVAGLRVGDPMDETTSIGIQKVSSDAEAVALMNDTRYGLTAGVYSPDEHRAKRLLAQVQAGSLYWNCCDRVSPRLPWSGCGDSGIGLTLSTYGIQTFTRPRAWHLRAA